MGVSKHQGNEHYCRLDRKTMSRPAWNALSPTAQALYPWFKMEWKGPRANNNGRIRLSVRQAAQRLGVTPTTAAKAIRDLQSKGWLVVYTKAVLGISGEARGHEYEITEIALPRVLERKEDRVDGKEPRPRQLFQFWKEGNDFPVADVRSNNPTGKNRGKQKPVIESMTNKDCHVIEIDTPCSRNYDVQASFREPSVIESMTSLLPGGVGEAFKSLPSFTALPNPITHIEPSAAPLRRSPFH
jgi:hypothetical protein